jgi:hypothetical protein
MRSFIACTLPVLLSFGGCQRPNEVIAPSRDAFTLTITNLPHLQAGEGHYELWGTFLEFNKTSGRNRPLHDEGFLSLGKFNIAPEGNRITNLEGGEFRLVIPEGANPQLLDDVIITLQHPTAPADTPASVIIGGKFRGSEREAVADLRVEYVDAFGSTFSNVRGSYTLIAPTSDPADSNSGVWFVEMGPPMSPSLKDLPALPDGWTYEGWVIDTGNPIRKEYYSTGKFLRPDTADFDGAGPGKGAGDGLEFPGQDFITGNPSRPDLSQFLRYAVGVSLEPYPDNSPAPYPMWILSSEAMVTIGRSVSLSFQMNNVASFHLPRATLTIAR